ncbi:MAG: C40 family peptidase [Thermoleophilia bacterium]
MAGRRHVSPRLVAALSAALVALPAVTAGTLAAAPGAGTDLSEPTARVDAAKARVDAVRAELEAASAELAAVRANIYRATDPAEREALSQEERELQDKKDALLARLDAEEAILRRIAAEDPPRDAPGGSGVSGGSETAGEPATSPIVVLPGLGTSATDTGVAAQPAVAQPASVVTAAATGPVPAGADGAARLDAYLSAKGSPLAGLGAVFVNESQAVGLDPRMLVAVSGAETSFGTYGPSQVIHNPFGLGPGMRFASWADAIHRAAQNLGGHLYLADGRVTIAAIQQRWAPEGALNDPTGLNSNWTRNVSRYFAELGGDPSASVFPNVPAVNLLAAPVLPTVGTAGPAAAQDALGLLGTPHPADRRGGLDAAALVQVVYARNGITLPATAAGQAQRGTPVEPTGLRPGDAVFFSTPDGVIRHVGLYLGDGQFVHAPGPGDTVGISSLYEAQWAQAYAGARRY